MLSKLEKAREFNAYLWGMGMCGTVMWFISYLRGVGICGTVIWFISYLRGVGMCGTVMWFISSIDAVKMSVAHRTLGETLTEIASEKTCNGNTTQLFKR